MNWTDRIALVALAAVGFVACQSTSKPAALDSRNEQCQTCRMIVSDAARASQIVAPYEEARFFDDLSCLSSYITAHPLASGAVIYVADHRTREWVRWDQAVYTRALAPGGAMGSPVVAHASVGSRDADPAAAGGTPVDVRDVFPASATRGSGGH